MSSRIAVLPVLAVALHGFIAPGRFRSGSGRHRARFVHDHEARRAALGQAERRQGHAGRVLTGRPDVSCHGARAWDLPRERQLRDARGGGWGVTASSAFATRANPLVSRAYYFCSGGLTSNYVIGIEDWLSDATGTGTPRCEASGSARRTDAAGYWPDGTRTRNARGTTSNRTGVVPGCSPSSSTGRGSSASTVTTRPRKSSSRGCGRCLPR